MEPAEVPPLELAEVPPQFRRRVSDDSSQALLARMELASVPEWLGNLTKLTGLRLRYRRREAKAVRHPEVGNLTLGFEVLNRDDALRLSGFQAEPGTADHDALKLLALAHAS